MRSKEQYNDIWRIGDATEIFSAEASAQMEGSSGMYQEYSRPVYSYIKGYPEEKAPGDNDSISLIYSGARWFMIHLVGARNNTVSEFWGESW